MKTTDNTILITGGTSGIGRALAVAFHQLGNQVIIAGRRQALLDEITAAHPGMKGIALDLQEAASIQSLAARVRDEFPTLNVLINNAGIAPLEDYSSGIIDPAATRSLVETNILSVIEVTAALLPGLLRQPQSTIITTTSGLAFVPLAPMATYCATKAFLHSWLQSLRFQLRKHPVEILELAPPYVQTELGGPAQASDPNAMPLADYIAEVMQLLAQPNPPQGEILVERVKHLRQAEVSGHYKDVFGALNPS